MQVNAFNEIQKTVLEVYNTIALQSCNWWAARK